MDESEFDVFRVLEELTDPKVEIPFDEDAPFTGDPEALTEFQVQVWCSCQTGVKPCQTAKPERLAETAIASRSVSPPRITSQIVPTPCQTGVQVIPIFHRSRPARGLSGQADRNRTAGRNLDIAGLPLVLVASFARRSFIDLAGQRLAALRPHLVAPRVLASRGRRQARDGPRSGHTAVRIQVQRLRETPALPHHVMKRGRTRDSAE